MELRTIWEYVRSTARLAQTQTAFFALSRSSKSLETRLETTFSRKLGTLPNRRRKSALQRAPWRRDGISTETRVWIRIRDISFGRVGCMDFGREKKGSRGCSVKTHRWLERTRVCGPRLFRTLSSLNRRHVSWPRYRAWKKTAHRSRRRADDSISTTVVFGPQTQRVSSSPRSTYLDRSRGGLGFLVFLFLKLV